MRRSLNVISLLYLPASKPDASGKYGINEISFSVVYGKEFLFSFTLQQSEKLETPIARISCLRPLVVLRPQPPHLLVYPDLEHEYKINLCNLFVAFSNYLRRLVLNRQAIIHGNFIADKCKATFCCKDEFMTPSCCTYHFTY